MGTRADSTLQLANEVARTCACFNLRKAARAITQLYDDALAGTGLRATQVTLLNAVYLGSEVPVTRMAEQLVMDRTTLTRNLQPLIKDGYIETVTGSDRRVKTVRLTARGRAALRNALPLWAEVQQRVVNGFGKANFKQLLRDLHDAVTLAEHR